MSPSAIHAIRDRSPAEKLLGKVDNVKLLNGNANQLDSSNHESGTTLNIPSWKYGDRKKMRIAIIGAGISGLNIFKVAEEKLHNVDLICYEKNHDIGGT